MYEKTLKPFPKRLKSLEEKTWMFRGKRLSLFRVFHHRLHGLTFKNRFRGKFNSPSVLICVICGELNDSGKNSILHL